MFPDEPSDEERLEQLPGDGATPFRPADDVINDGNLPIGDGREQSRFDTTLPATDTNIDPAEAYDEGEAGASELQEPNAGNTVVGYDPDADRRRTQVQDDSSNL